MAYTGETLDGPVADRVRLRVSATRSSLLVPLVAGLLAAAAVGVVAVGVVTGDGAAVSEPVVLGDAQIVTVNNSPAAASNPQDPDNVVVVNRQDRPGFSAAINTSTDGGAEFTTATPPLPDGLDRPYAPSVAFAADGTASVLYVNLTGPGNQPDNLWLAGSADGGRSFAEPVRVAGELTFQARLAVDPDAGALYATWLQATEVGLLSFPGAPPRIVAARSTDGGRTWSDPVPVSDPGRQRVGAAVPAVLPDGTLVVVYKDFKGDVRDWQNLEGPVWPDPFALVATRSTDRAASFEPGTEFDSELVPTERFVPFLPTFPSVSPGPDGELYAAWADGRNGDADVFLRTSPDGGRQWSEPVRVNQNPSGDGTDQKLPAVGVAPDGRVDVLYLDGRADPGGVMLEASLSSSQDAGRTFDRTVVSPQPFSSEIGVRAGPDLPIDFGTRQAVLSLEDRTLSAWTDTSRGTTATARQDVVAATLRRGGSGIATPAAASGLLLGSVALFAVWWQRRR